MALAAADSFQAFLQNRFVAPAALLALTLLVFSPLILGGGFFWDDAELLTDNAAVHAAGGLWQIWFPSASPDYYPLMSSTFWLEWHLWGNWAPGYHLTNVLLHWGSAVLLWRVLGKLAIPGALLAAAIFAVHPVAVESVAWIAERKNTLSLVLMLAAVLMYLRADGDRLPKGSYIAAIVLFLLALLSKTAVVMLPVVLLILAWYRRGRVGRRDGVRLAPFFALSAALGMVTIFFQYHHAIGDVPVRTDGFVSRLAVAGWAVWFYLGKALVPANLCFNYPRWNNILGMGPVAFVPLAALAVLATWMWIRRKTPLRHALVALVCYVALLLPMLGFLNIFFMRYSYVSDHWQYHALPCIIAWAVGAAVWLMRRSGPRYQQAWLIAGGGVMVALAAYSVRLAVVYRSADSIWRHALACNPNAWLAHSNLGMEQYYLFKRYHNPAALERALVHFGRAVETAPDADINYVNFGNALITAGRSADALQIYMAGLGVAQSDRWNQTLLDCNIGEMLAQEGRTAEAIIHLRRAADLSPKYPRAPFQLGRLLVAVGDPKGIVSLRRAVELAPESIPMRLELAKALLGRGNREGAILELHECLRRDATSTEARGLLKQAQASAATSQDRK